MINYNKKFAIDILKTIILPFIIGILFIIWVIYLFQYPVHTFPTIFFIFLPIYLISGSVFGGILITFAIAAALFSVNMTDYAYMLMLEVILLIVIFYVLEQHRNKFIFSKKRLIVEHEILDRDIALIQSSILNSENKSSGLLQRMDSFQTFGQIIQSLEATLTQEELILKIEKLANKFIGKGKWKIKPSNKKDPFMAYVQTNNTALLIPDTSKNNYFTKQDYKSHLSIVVVPIEVEGSFWGIIKGTIDTKFQSFNDSDVRLLYVLSNSFSIALYNILLFNKLEELAITDTLTGVYTRNYFMERLKEEMQRASVDKVPMTIAMIDVDNFKQVNDTYGHQSGDIVLKKISSMLIARFRETDIVARYGGEEFAILMPHTDITKAVAILEELRENISKEYIVLPAQEYRPIKITRTISVGLKKFEDEISQENLIAKADEALYKAKNTGKNKVCIYKNNEQE